VLSHVAELPTKRGRGPASPSRFLRDAGLIAAEGDDLGDAGGDDAGADAREAIASAGTAP
jgi:hypothetical protein